MAVDDSIGVLYHVAGPSPTAPGKFIIRPCHVAAWPGTVTDAKGGEVPVVNLYVLDRKPGEPGLGKNVQEITGDPNAVRYVIAVEDVPLLVDYLELSVETSLWCADPGAPVGEA